MEPVEKRLASSARVERASRPVDLPLPLSATEGAAAISTSSVDMAVVEVKVRRGGEREWASRVASTWARFL